MPTTSDNDCRRRSKLAYYTIHVRAITMTDVNFEWTIIFRFKLYYCRWPPAAPRSRFARQRYRTQFPK